MARSGWKGLDRRSRKVVAGCRVGAMLDALRKDQRRGQLSAELIESLESIPGWTWARPRLSLADPDRAQLAGRLDQLRTLLARTPLDRIDADAMIDGVSACGFVQSLRTRGAQEDLPAWVRREVEKLPGWSWTPRDREAYHRGRLKLLTEFLERKGWGELTRRRTVHGVPLLSWWKGVKRRHHAGRLPRWLTRELNRLPGIDWGRSGEKGTGFVDRRNLQLLRKLVRRGGSANVVTSTRVDGHPVGIWAAGVRAARREGTLAPWLEKALERIPGWSWDGVMERHRENVRILREALAEGGWPAVLGARTAADGSMREWIWHRRRDRRAGRLDPELEVELSAIPGWSWNPDAEVSRRNVEKFREYIRRHGWAGLQSETRFDDLQIYAYILERRKERREGILENWLRHVLEEIPGWSWDRPLIPRKPVPQGPDGRFLRPPADRLRRHRPSRHR